MTDLHERATQVVEKYKQLVTFYNRNWQEPERQNELIILITAALEQVREEDAKVAETFPVQTVETVQYRKKIATAIRQGAARGRRGE